MSLVTELDGVPEVRMMGDRNVKWTKGTGHDWTVRYRFEDDEIEEMSVFGVLTVEEATKEARYSLNGYRNMNEGTYEILAVFREMGNE